MNNQLKSAQGILSIAALLCLIVGWFHFLPEEITILLSKRLFYILVGASFIVQAPFIPNRNYLYPMYIAAALCIVGAFLPLDSRFAGIKIIGLFAGAIISFFNRQSQQR